MISLVRLLLALLLLRAADAFIAQPRAASLPRLRTRVVAQQVDDDDLAAQFAAERERRTAQPDDDDADPEPFTGVKEIVLDEAGRPKAISKRPPPTPAWTQQDQVADLFTTPQFAFGIFMTVGVTILLAAIAGADSSTW